MEVSFSFCPWILVTSPPAGATQFASVSELPEGRRKVGGFLHFRNTSSNICEAPKGRIQAQKTSLWRDSIVPERPCYKQLHLPLSRNNFFESL